MVSNNQIMQIGLPLAGAAVGSAYGSAGAQIGMAAGGLVASGLGLMEDTKPVPGASAKQQQIAGMSMNALTDLSRQQGLDPRAVSRMSQSAYEAQNQALGAANAGFNADLTPLERQMFQDYIIGTIQGISKQSREQVKDLDPMAEANRITKIISGAGVQSQIQTNIDQQNRMARLEFEQKQARKLKTFTDSVSSMLTLASKTDFSSLDDKMTLDEMIEKDFEDTEDFGSIFDELDFEVD